MWWDLVDQYDAEGKAQFAAARPLTTACPPTRPLVAQIQQAAERLERNFVDSRQLKVCATCFDLSVSLLRVLEMTITLVPEIFLDWSQPTSEMLLRRLAQVCASRQGGWVGPRVPQW